MQDAESFFGAVHSLVNHNVVCFPCGVNFMYSEITPILLRNPFFLRLHNAIMQVALQKLFKKANEREKKETECSKVQSLLFYHSETDTRASQRIPDTYFVIVCKCVEK